MLTGLVITEKNEVKVGTLTYGFLSYVPHFKTPGWKFIPNTSARTSSRKIWADKEQAIPAWVRKAGRAHFKADIERLKTVKPNEWATEDALRIVTGLK